MSLSSGVDTVPAAGLDSLAGSLGGGGGADVTFGDSGSSCASGRNSPSGVNNRRSVTVNPDSSRLLSAISYSSNENGLWFSGRTLLQRTLMPLQTRPAPKAIAQPWPQSTQPRLHARECPPPGGYIQERFFCPRLSADRQRS